jgi:chromosome partitioning protein
MKLDLNQWAVNDVLKLFQSDVNRQTIIAAEREGRIPAAIRQDRGVKARVWSLSSLPAIGKLYGFIRPPQNQVRICVYTAKGGVLKTTISYTLARILALHGIKVLLVGLDSQGSATTLALNPLDNIESLDQLPVYKNIGDLIFKGVTIDDVIQHTNLPTLDLIPETDSLSDINSLIGTKAAVGATSKNMPDILRYQYFARNFLPLVKDYEVVIFDNSPSWSFLIENSLYCSDYLISPTACDPGSYQVLDNNLNATFELGSRMGREWRKVFLVPTLKDTNKLSSQIHASYINRYPDIVTNTSIRRTVKGAEAFSIGCSPIEYDVTSELAADYFALVKEIWDSILRDQNGTKP